MASEKDTLLENEFYVHVTVHRNNFFTIKPTRCINFTNLFWHETLHISDSSSVHQQEFIHCTLSNGICLQTCMTYTIAECTVNKLLLMDRRTVRNMWSFMPK